MNMLGQIREQVIQLQRQVQDQLRLIESFRKANQENMTLVRTQLSGSARGHDRAMVQAIDRAENALEKSTQALARAEQALQRVSLI